MANEVITIENLSEFKTKYDQKVSTSLGGKQDTLESGTNIKTINGTSILGSGNIEVGGGGTEYTAGDNISISDDHVISVTGTVPNAAKISTKGPYRDKVISYVSDDGDEYEVINLSVNGMFIGPYGSDNDEGSVKLVTGTNKADVIINRTGGGTNNISLYNTYTAVAGKQDTISDLATIRSGASAGATAVQPDAISDMATETWVGEQGFAKSSDIPEDIMVESNLFQYEGYYYTYNGIYFKAFTADNAAHADNADFADSAGTAGACDAASYAAEAANATNDENGDRISITYLKKFEAEETYQSKLTGVTDIQMVSSLPASPVATVLYLIPEA